MKNQTYQLSAQGIERLEKFKRDVLAGDFEVKTEPYSDGGVAYYVVSAGGSCTCCFGVDESEIANDTLNQIEKTLSNVLGGVPITDSDMELTP